MGINDVFNIAVQKVANNIGLDYPFDNYKKVLDSYFSEYFELEKKYICEFKDKGYCYIEEDPISKPYISNFNNSEKFKAWESEKTYNPLTLILNGQLEECKYEYRGYGSFGRDIDSYSIKSVLGN